MSLLDGDEKNKSKVDINAYEEKVSHSCFSLREINNFFEQEFFTDINKRRHLIRRIKFLLIRIKVEYMALDNLLSSYQECLKELLSFKDNLQELI